MLKHIDIEDGNYPTQLDNQEEVTRACNDMLRNANTSMMSWAEKNFKMKLIDNLYHMGYYKYNQTIYLKDKK